LFRSGIGVLDGDALRHVVPGRSHASTAVWCAGKSIAIPGFRSAASRLRSSIGCEILRCGPAADPQGERSE